MGVPVAEGPSEKREIGRDHHGQKMTLNRVASSVWPDYEIRSFERSSLEVSPSEDEVREPNRVRRGRGRFPVPPCAGTRKKESGRSGPHFSFLGLE